MARRRNRRFRGRRRNTRRGFGLKRQNGGMLRGRMHPPSNSASPWNNLVCTFMWRPAPATKEIPFQTIQTLSAGALRLAVRTELSLSGKIDMRVRRFDVWTQPQTQNSTRNTIVLAPCDWTRCEGNVLNWFEAWGTSVQPAHCHYVWPRSITNIVIPDSGNCPIVRFDVRDESFAFVVKAHVVWRKSEPNPLQLTEGLLTSLRTTRYPDPPSPDDDDYLLVDKGHAVSPLALGVDALMR